MQQITPCAPRGGFDVNTPVLQRARKQIIPCGRFGFGVRSDDCWFAAPTLRYSSFFRGGLLSFLRIEKSHQCPAKPSILQINATDSRNNTNPPPIILQYCINQWREATPHQELAFFSDSSPSLDPDGFFFFDCISPLESSCSSLYECRVAHTITVVSSLYIFTMTCAP